MIDTTKYTYVITPAASPFGGFGARCLEIPDVSCLGETPATALEACTELARTRVETMSDPPEPFSTRIYSGHISVRVPPSLHRALVFEARRQGVSLNELINRKLGVLARMRG
jgi:predicted RNase H-like HicB family nuclease